MEISLIETSLIEISLVEIKAGPGEQLFTVGSSDQTRRVHSV